MTPIPLSMSVPLVQSLQHDAVSSEHDIDNYIGPRDGGLTGYRGAVALALGKERDGQVETTWAVERIDRGRLLRLRAQMRAPGRAWLELSVEPEGAGSRYRQRAIFFPKGLSGSLYWLAVLPFHSLIFPAMARNITAAGRKIATAKVSGRGPGGESGTAPAADEPDAKETQATP